MNREKEKKVLTVYALTILTCLLVLIGVKVWEIAHVHCTTVDFLACFLLRACATV